MGLERTPTGSLTHRLRNYLLAGIVVSAPITITLFIVWQVLGYVDRTVTPFIPTRYNPETYLPFGIPGVGLVIMLGLLILIGWAAAGMVGVTIMRTGEQLLDRTPIVRGIYSTLKQLFETALSQSSRSFREVVLIEYPRPGIWSVGFVTGEPSADIARASRRAGQRLRADHAHPGLRVPHVPAAQGRQGARHDRRGGHEAGDLRRHRGPAGAPASRGRLSPRPEGGPRRGARRGAAIAEAARCPPCGARGRGRAPGPPARAPRAEDRRAGPDRRT